MKFLALRLFIFALFFGLVQAKEKNSKTQEIPVGKALVKKALAENAIFRCSVETTLKSKSSGDKLDKELLSNCKKQIDGLKIWYKSAQKKQQRAQLLLANGKRSALANRQ